MRPRIFYKAACFCLAVALCLLCSGCGSSVSPVGTWELENASDGSGNLVSPRPSIVCTVSREGILSLSGDREAEGSYTAHAMRDGTLRLEVSWGNGSHWIGTCGVRTYADGSETLVLILSGEDNLLSFLPQI